MGIFSSNVDESFTGFNPDKIVDQEEKIQKAYERITDVMSNDFKHKLENNLKDHYGSGRATQTMESFYKQASDLFDQNITSNFVALIQAINNAGASWAEFEKSGLWTGGLTLSEAKLSLTAEMPESVKGNVGADSLAPNILKDTLGEIIEDVKSEIQKAIDAVDACGFLDQQKKQMESELNSIEALKNIIEKSLNTYSESVVSQMQDEHNTRIDQANGIATGLSIDSQ